MEKTRNCVVIMFGVVHGGCVKIIIGIAQAVGPAHELAAYSLWLSGLPMGKPYYWLTNS